MSRRAGGATGESACTTRFRTARALYQLRCPGKADPARPLLTVIGETGKASTTDAANYDGIVRVIAEFFQTGRPPVDPAETVEVFEFMTAADRSKERQGAEVALAELR